MIRLSAADIEAKSARNKAAWSTGIETATYTAEKPRKLAKAKPMPRIESSIEGQLALQIVLCQLPTPVRNYKFLADRKFEFDFCWIDQKLAVEVQGLCHRIKSKWEADIEKRWLAHEAGWVVIEVSGKNVRDGVAIQRLQKMFAKRGAK